MFKLFFFSLLLIPLFLDAQVISTYASPVYNPGGMVFDSTGNLYVTTVLGCKILKIDTSGAISTIAGTGISGYNGDSIPATNALLNQPAGITIDSLGNIIFSDDANNRIRKIDILTGLISTIVGNGTGSFTGDSGMACFATIFHPTDICFDKKGNLFFSDWSNYRIRKVNKYGIINTIAGNGLFGSSGDGGLAISASCFPNRFCFDSYDNLYFTQYGTSFETIRKIDTLGIISTIAGDTISGNYLYNGDGIPAITAYIDPEAIKCDRNNQLYLCDVYNNRIRIIDTLGIIHTVAGNGIAGYSGNGGMADTAEIHKPTALVFDKCWNLFIGETDNQVIRKVTFDSTCNISSVKVEKIMSKGNLALYPNPAYSTLTIQTNEKINNIAITNVLGQSVLNKEYKDEDKVEMDVSILQAGVYFVRVNDRWVRFVKE